MLNESDEFNADVSKSTAVMQNIMGNNQIMSNPMVRNIMNMAQRGDIQGIEKFGRNIAKKRELILIKHLLNLKTNSP